MTKKITGNLATFPDRIHILPKMVASIIDQVDELRIFFNDMKRVDKKYLKPLYDNPKIKLVTDHAKDLTDNGKFFFIPPPDSDDEIYFMLDDDLLYPKDYVKKTIEFMAKYPNTIITYHGRKLKGKGLSYYRGHEAFRCLGNVHSDKIIDVCGTGVSAFDTYYFKPNAKILSYSLRQKMSDLVFSLEVAREGMEIMLCNHKLEWFGYLNPKNTIWDQHANKPTPYQNSMADQIYDFNYATKNTK